MEVHCQVAVLQDPFKCQYFSQCVYCKVYVCVCYQVAWQLWCTLTHFRPLSSLVGLSCSLVSVSTVRTASWLILQQIFSFTRRTVHVYGQGLAALRPHILNRLTRVSNHSSGCSGVHCADTAEPPQSSPPPTDTTTTAPAPAFLLICPYKVNMNIKSNPGYEKLTGR